MPYSKLWALLDLTRLSPEQLAPIFGVSNMTIRRWRRENPDKAVPKSYERLVARGLQELVIQGRLSSENENVAEILEKTSSDNILAALNGMGIQTDSNDAAGTSVIPALEQIGGSSTRRNEVESAEERILGFGKLGQEWAKSIRVLLKVIRTPSLTLIEKTAAYGALFYLLCPLDLIPDHIPIFGLTDDLAMLTAAAGFYVAKQILPADSLS